MKALIDIYVDKLISLGGRSSSIFMGKESSKVFYFSKYNDMINEVEDTYVLDLSIIMKQCNLIDKEIYKIEKANKTDGDKIVELTTPLIVEKKEILKFPKLVDTVVKESKRISFEKGVDTLCFGMNFIELSHKDYVFRAPLFFEEVIVTKDAKKYTFEKGQRKWNINLLHTVYLKIHGESLKLDLNKYSFENCNELLKDLNLVDVVVNSEINYLSYTTQEKLKKGEPKVVLYPNVMTLGIYDSKLLTIYMETKKLAESADINNLNLRKIFDIKSNFELNAKGYLDKEVYNDETKSIIKSETFHNVTDVDFSQANVVQNAINNTMVVKGPPGTGKTETILNILANNYIAGKRVLVVAEKLVALEVLYKRIVKNANDMSYNTLFLKHFNTLGKLEMIEKSRQIYNNNTTTNTKETNEVTFNYPLNETDHDSFINYKEQFKLMADFDPNTLPNNYELINNNIDKYTQIASVYETLQNTYNNNILNNLFFDTFLYNNRTYDLIYDDITTYTFKYQVIKTYHENFKKHDKEILELNYKQVKDNIKTYSSIYEDFSYMKEVVNNEEYKFYYPSLNDKTFNYQKLKEEYASLINQVDINSLNTFYNNYETHLLIDEDFLTYKTVYQRHCELQSDKNYLNLFSDIKYYLDFLKNNDYSDKLHLLIKKKPYNEKFSFGIVNEFSGGFAKLKGSEQDYYLDLFETFLKYHELNEKVNAKFDIFKVKNSDYNVIVKIDTFISKIYQFKFIDKDHEIVKVLSNIKHEKNVFKYSITEYEFLQKYHNLLNLFDDKQLYKYKPSELSLFLDYKKIIKSDSEKLFEIPDDFITNYLLFCEHMGYKNSNEYKQLFSVSYDDILKTIEFNDCLEIYNNRKKQVEAVLKYRKNITTTYSSKTNIAKNLITNMHKNISDELFSGNYSKGFFAIRENKERFNKSIRSMIHDNNDEFKKMFPIVITSPLNVASVLQYDDFANHFDLVIFDEASQLLPEHAIYSLALGKDYIIVGDEKQLQPSNFFTTATSNEEILEVLETSEENESLLDIANRNLASASKKMLNYHYRSENDLLIKFSNDEFYDSKLVAISNGQYDDVPYEVVNVEDATWEEQSNTKEAERVVDTVFNLRLKYPNKTLGIITVNAKQAIKIEELITYNLRNNKEFSNLFKDEFELSEDNEYIFVKNIENVQGDERDIIVFSLAYAKNNKGIINANYGSINRLGGANRLNVAFSRAKYKFVLVKSVNANELKVTNAPGSILLHKFISFVETCDHKKYYNMDQVNNQVAFDSPFEEEVYNALKINIDNKKYNLITQYGSSGYTIDIVITDKNHKPLLGLECDGATYHSSTDAKNRDYFRQKYLEDRGWNIHRIWSTNWWNNRSGEIDKVVKTLNILTKKDYLTEELIPYVSTIKENSGFVFEDEKTLKPLEVSNEEKVINESPTIIISDKIVEELNNIVTTEEVASFEEIAVSIIAPRDNIALGEKYVLYDEIPFTYKTITEPFRKKTNRAICVPAPRDNIKLAEKYALYDEVISKVYAIKNKKIRKQITSSPEYDIMTAYKENLGKHEKTDEYIKLLMKQIESQKQVKKVNYTSKKIIANESYIVNKDNYDNYIISPGVYRFNTASYDGKIIVANTFNQQILTVDLKNEISGNIKNYDPQNGHKALVLEEGYILKTTNETLNLVPVKSGS